VRPRNSSFIVAGTDTGVGKTVFAAALAGALGADYWKPVQAGLDGPTDSEIALELGSLVPERVHEEAYRLTTAASPHRAARLDGVEIDVSKLRVPDVQHSLVIELAGGLLVPLSPSTLQIDVIADWRIPVILVARTTLGTINHSLLSIEAMRRRRLPIAGIAFVGEENRDSEAIICEIGGTRRLGRLPIIDPLTAEMLASAFAENFRLEDLR
jgi:dethiobiotin synthetase